MLQSTLAQKCGPKKVVRKTRKVDNEKSVLAPSTVEKPRKTIKRQKIVNGTKKSRNGITHPVRRLIGGGVTTRAKMMQQQQRPSGRSLKKSPKSLSLGGVEPLRLAQRPQLKKKRTAVPTSKPTNKNTASNVQMAYNETVQRIMQSIQPGPPTLEPVLQKMIIHSLNTAITKRPELNKYKFASQKLLLAVSETMRLEQMPPHILDQAAYALEDYLLKK